MSLLHTGAFIICFARNRTACKWTVNNHSGQNDESGRKSVNHSGWFVNKRGVHKKCIIRTLVMHGGAGDFVFRASTWKKWYEQKRVKWISILKRLSLWRIGTLLAFWTEGCWIKPCLGQKWWYMVNHMSYSIFPIKYKTKGLWGTLGDDGDDQRKLSTLDQRKLSSFGISTSCLCMWLCVWMKKFKNSLNKDNMLLIVCLW